MLQVTVDILRHIFPVNQISRERAAGLLPHCRIRGIQAGRDLFGVGQKLADYFYVLEGSVSLTNAEETRFDTVGPVFEQQALPMPYAEPSKHRAWANVDSKVLLIPKAQLHELLQEPRPEAHAGPLFELRYGDGPLWHPSWNRPGDPVAVPSGGAPAPAAAPPQERAVAPVPQPILLVEDHPTDAKVAQLMLQKLGYQADWARNGREALKKLEQKTYDIVLLDVQLPGVDGFEVTKLIRERWPAAQGPRVIALTARSLKGDREACLAAGMDDYLSKPISLEVLSAKLNRENWALIDPTVLESLSKAVGRPGVLQLIETFQGALAEMVNEVRDAIESGNTAAVERAGHSLKAAAQVLGIKLIAGYAAKLERIGQSGTSTVAMALLSQIENVRQETEYELKKIRAVYEKP